MLGSSSTIRTVAALRLEVVSARAGRGGVPPCNRSGIAVPTR
jgi:hypothetical protein